MELFCPLIAEMDPAGVEALHHLDIEPRVHWSVPLIRDDGQPEEAGETRDSLPTQDRIQRRLDCGFDHTNLPGSCDGWLRKCTFAPQIGADRKFFGRPVLRAFVTYANWSNGFRGLVGGVPFEKATTGLTYGVQAEHWW